MIDRPTKKRTSSKTAVAARPVSSGLSVSTSKTTPAPRRSPAKRDFLKAEAVAVALVVEAVFVRELVIGSLGSRGCGGALGSDLHAEVEAFSSIERRQK
jgi:hypothetical protein